MMKILSEATLEAISGAAYRVRCDFERNIMDPGTESGKYGWNGYGTGHSYNAEIISVQTMLDIIAQAALRSRDAEMISLTDKARGIQAKANVELLTDMAGKIRSGAVPLDTGAGTVSVDKTGAKVLTKDFKKAKAKIPDIDVVGYLQAAAGTMKAISALVEAVRLDLQAAPTFEDAKVKLPIRTQEIVWYEDVKVEGGFGCMGGEYSEEEISRMGPRIENRRQVGYVSKSPTFAKVDYMSQMSKLVTTFDAQAQALEALAKTVKKELAKNQAVKKPAAKKRQVK